MAAFITIVPEDAARAIAHECGQEMAAFLTRGREDELVAAITKVLNLKALGVAGGVLGIQTGRYHMPIPERLLQAGSHSERFEELLIVANREPVKDLVHPDTPLTRLIRQPEGME